MAASRTEPWMCAQPIERPDVPEIAAWTRHCEVERCKWRKVAVSHGADGGIPEACEKVIYTFFELIHNCDHYIAFYISTFPHANPYTRRPAARSKGGYC